VEVGQNEVRLRKIEYGTCRHKQDTDTQRVCGLITPGMKTIESDQSHEDV